MSKPEQATFTNRRQQTILDALHDGVRYVAIRLGDKFNFYHEGMGLPKYEALPDGTVRPWRAKRVFCLVKQLRDTGETWGW